MDQQEGADLGPGAAGADAEVAAELAAERHQRRLEVITVVLLALAALATAWSGYQASLWDGNQSSSYTQASSARTEAAQQRTEANEHRLGDLTLFENFVNATIAGDEFEAQFYRDRFTPTLLPAFEAWIALEPFDNPAAPPSPFAMSEYQLPQDAEADRLEALADELFQTGEYANTVSDVYTLTTLLFAAVLFFAAIAERFSILRAQVFLISLAALGLIVGLVIAFGQPITTGS